MYKKTISYVDFNGDNQKEDFYFNLTKTEALDLTLNEDDGNIVGVLKTALEKKDQQTLFKYLKLFVEKSYGIKSEDGRRFIKNPTVLEEFRQTEAYSELIVELGTNEKSAAEFISGIMPNIEGMKEAVGVIAV